MKRFFTLAKHTASIRRYVFQLATLHQIYLRLFWRQKYTRYIYFALIFVSFFIVSLSWYGANEQDLLEYLPMQPESSSKVFTIYRQITINLIGKISNADFQLLQTSANKSSISLKLLSEVSKYTNKEYTIIIRELNVKRNILDYRIRQEKIDFAVWYTGNPFGDVVTLPHIIKHNSYGKQLTDIETRKLRCKLQYTFDAIFLDAIGISDLNEMMKLDIQLENLVHLKQWRTPDTGSAFFCFSYAIWEIMMLLPLFVLLNNFSLSRNANRLLRSLGISSFQVAINKLLYGTWLIAPICLAGVIILHYGKTNWDIRTRFFNIANILLYTSCKAALFVIMDELFGYAIYVLFIISLFVHFALFALAIFFLPNSINHCATVFASLNPAAALAMSFHTLYISTNQLPPDASPFPTTLPIEFFTLALFIDFFLHFCFIRMITFDKEAFSIFRLQNKRHINVDKIGKALLNENLVIRNLHKAWNNAEVVLKGVNLRTEENSITTLLGENGCGKSTLFSCIGGSIKPTEGHISICGKDLTTNKEKCQRMIGLCPQDNPVLLFFTVYEHILLFFRLRTMRRETELEIKELVDMVHQFRMIEKLNEEANTLSGGQMRKLFVMTAFVGYTKVVLLDEPMAGVDHISRRDFRNFIVNSKTNKSIIITTHYVAEVEIFTDSVAFLSGGHIICHDTINELAKIYLNGIRISILFQAKALSASNEVAHLRNKLSKFLEMQTNGVAIPCDEKSYDFNSKNEMKIIIPFAAKKILPALFVKLEDKREEFHIETFNAQNSLEQIFIRATNQAAVSNNCTLMPKIECLLNRCLLPTAQFVGLMRKIQILFIGKWRLFIVPFVLLLFTFIPYALLHYGMGVRKIYSIQERQIFAKDLPSFTILLQDNNLKNRNITYYDGLFTPPNLKKKSPKTISKLDKLLQKYDKFQQTTIPQFVLLGYTKSDFTTVRILPEQQLIMTQPPRAFGFSDFFYETGDSLSKTVYPRKIKYNFLLNYAEMYGVNFFTNFLLFVRNRTGVVKCGLEIRPTREQLSETINKLAEVFKKFTTAFIVTLLYLMFFGILVYNDVEERKSFFQHQVYFTKTTKALCFASDAICLFPYFAIYTTLLFTMAHFLLDMGIANTLAPSLGILIIVAYYCANIFNVFMISNWFKSPSKAFLFYVLVCGIIAFMFLSYIVINVTIALYFMEDVTNAHSLANLLENLLNIFHIIFPSLAINNLMIIINLRSKIEVIYNYLTVFFICFTIRLTLLFLMESRKIRSIFTLWRRKQLTHLMHIKRSHMILLDSCVLDSSNSSKKFASSEPSACSLKSVYKFYKRQSCAVQKLNLNVHYGESFALLGTNGAGKTTLFNMLSSVTIPSAGLALIKQEKVETSVASVAYCPQKDALVDYMTPRQTLQLIAILHGVRNVQQQVRKTLYCLRLNSKADKLVKTLSGGQKRRLSLGVALINGGKTLTILDEPTAGIDVRSRWHVWRILKELQLTKPTTILLATHDMEECELLCERVGFMNSGSLLALGTCQQLKLRFLRTVMLKIFIRRSAFNSMMSMHKIQNLHERIKQRFDILKTMPSDIYALNIKSLPTVLTYEIALSGQSWSQIYANAASFIDSLQSPNYQSNDLNVKDNVLINSICLESHCQSLPTFPEIVDFSITNNSMEQVFEMLAQTNFDVMQTEIK